MGLFFALGACRPDDIGQAADDTAVIRTELTRVPDGVRCIELRAEGSRVVERRFDVTAGQAAVLELSGLPAGPVVVSAAAYDQPCNQLTSSSAPSWISQATPVTLQQGRPLNITLEMRRSTRVGVSLDFRDDPDAGAMPDGGARDGASGGADAPRADAPASADRAPDRAVADAAVDRAADFPRDTAPDVARDTAPDAPSPADATVRDVPPDECVDPYRDPARTCNTRFRCGVPLGDYCNRPIDCGTCGAGQVCIMTRDGFGIPQHSECEPCVDSAQACVGKNCGEVRTCDGQMRTCSSTRSCGPGCTTTSSTCDSPFVCTNNVCSCPDGAPSCGLRRCGTVQNSCGQAVSCGSCAPEESCVGGQCIYDPCRGVRCPRGSTCIDGLCTPSDPF